jgi:hypothetical protein
MSLAAIKAKLLENQAKKTSGGEGRSSGGDNASYPFWNIPDNSQAIVRFLPDGDKDNVFFWQKREVIKMPFSGVVGGEYPTNNEVTVQVPCIDMFGMSCPVTAAIRPWWKGTDAEKELARVYYKKKSYIYQGFVVRSPFEENSTPENPIRRFIINQSIHELVEQSLMDPDMEDSPTDFIKGRDFVIKKTKKGQYANYQTSSWAMKERSLTEAELVAVDQHGLFSLKEYMGRQPDANEVEAIKAMFDDSVAGRPFDAASYGQYYRAFGGGGGGGGGNRSETSAPAPAASAPASAPAARYESEPADAVQESAPAAAAPSAKSAQDILDRIRNRANA